MNKCPCCAEEMQDEVIVCKHCGNNLEKNPTGRVSPMKVVKKLYSWITWLHVDLCR